MHALTLPDGSPFPRLGLGTWRMGEDAATQGAEVAAVRTALDLGYRLIDTAEMYGEGGAETVVGQAVSQALRAGALRREDLLLVSKVYPHNASRRGTVAACERSLRRLGVDQIDLYLLHWRGSHPLRETVDAFESLVAAGRIRHWGVSNFDVDDLAELAALDTPAGRRCATNQVYFSLSERGPEHSLLPWMHAHGMPLMAYSPIDQGRMADDTTLAGIGAPCGLSAAQVALAWVLAQPGVVAIPKAVSAAHLRDNLTAASVQMTPAQRQQIDAAYPAPTRKTPLAMI